MAEMKDEKDCTSGLLMVDKWAGLSAAPRAA